MSENPQKTVRSIQAEMARSAVPCFSKAEVDNLNCLIRLAVEFQHCAHEIGAGDEGAVQNCAESVFSGVSSFCSVTRAYKVLAGEVPTSLRWDTLTLPDLRERFMSTFREFTAEGRFERKCRLLLDLFKLQLALASILYE